MVNWYYVAGSERVGPVNESVLFDLLGKNEIHHETYIWKKGFASWEKLKDVPEIMGATQEKFPEPVKSSPEIRFKFDWRNLKEDEELFFIKIGMDRNDLKNTQLFGPYSSLEIKEAIKMKRLNAQTLVFAAGMSSWVKLGVTPFYEGSKEALTDDLSLKDIPHFFAIDHSPLPLVALCKKYDGKTIQLLGAGPYQGIQNQKIMASLYKGKELQERNIELKIVKYDVNLQIILCHFSGHSPEIEKILKRAF